MAYTSMDTGEITRWSMAYINLKISSLDNGRIVGYDNSHGGPHKHWLGKVIQLEPDTSYFTILSQFKQEVGEILVNNYLKGKTKMKEDKRPASPECEEFNDFFKKAESIIKKAEEYRLKQQSAIQNTELSEKLKNPGR